MRFMSEAATKQDIEELRKSNKQDIEGIRDDILGVLKDFMELTDKRFSKSEHGIHAIKTDIGEVKQEIVDLKVSHNHLVNTVDTFIARIDRQEIEQISRDNQFEKLLIWARKVSKKTGIPLENL